jgi:hypothetical protein
LNENDIFGFVLLTAVAVNWTLFWAAMSRGPERTQLAEGREVSNHQKAAASLSQQNYTASQLRIWNSLKLNSYQF